MKNRSKPKQLSGIKLIAIINGLAALLYTVFFGDLAFIKLPAITSLKNSSKQINFSTTYGFGIADLLWPVPLTYWINSSLEKAGNWLVGCTFSKCFILVFFYSNNY
ncbi:hypothetical protein [Lutibacter flavus]|uniref:hypothetical protein n=1 Tax=Lutibacter flavus TaxID=691689 RepID=UPI0011314896|nr:hypothetical protein [Lutibacter flavus]